MAGIEKGIDKSDEASSKALVLKLYPGGLGEHMAIGAGYDGKPAWRKVLEPTEATTQCEKSGHSLATERTCYICGLEIPDKKTLMGPADELWPECEHILPLTEGRWLLDTYIASRINEGGWFTTARNLEYAQAHRVCNQAKSNLSFLVTSADPVVVSDAAIRTILGKIKARAAEKINQTKNPALLTQIAQMGVDVRLPVIRQRVQGLADHINNDPLRQPGRQGFYVLFQSALMVDPSSLPPGARTVHDEWYAGNARRQAEYQAELATFQREFFMRNERLSTPRGVVQFLQQTLPPPTLNDPKKADTLAAFQGIIASLEGVLNLRELLNAMFDKQRELNRQRKPGTPEINASLPHLQELMLYGLYSQMLKHIKPTNDASQRLYCVLVKRMEQFAYRPGKLVYATNKPGPVEEPKPVDLFGAPPSSVDVCKRFAGESDRELRAYLSEMHDENPALDDTYVTNVLRALSKTIPHFTKSFFGRTSSKPEIDRAVEQAKKAIALLLATYPGNFDAAIRIAARSFVESTPIRLELMRYDITGILTQEYVETLMTFFLGRPDGGRRKTRRRRKARKTLRKRVRA